MQKYFLLTTLCFSFLVTMGQTSEVLTPKAGDKQAVMGVWNNATFLMFKKHKNETKACRLGLEGNYLYHKEPSTSDDPKLKGFSETYNFNLLLGFQKRLGSFDRFEPYLGSDFSLGTWYRSKSYSTKRYDSFLSADVYRTETEVARPGVSVGVIPFLGFNYYLMDRLAIGVEYRIPIFGFGLARGVNNKIEEVDEFGDLKYSAENTVKRNGFSIGGSLSGTAIVTATLYINKR
ncbi:MAG: hypothetical protein ACK40G_06815 [Cytophagaceae bacterium]